MESPAYLSYHADYIPPESPHICGQTSVQTDVCHRAVSKTLRYSFLLLFVWPPQAKLVLPTAPTFVGGVPIALREQCRVLMRVLPRDLLRTACSDALDL